MARYRFSWRRRDVERPQDAGGWRTKTINAGSDAEAAQKMLTHCENLCVPLEIDYEMSRADVVYDPNKHAEKFWDMQRAGIQLEVG